MHVEIDNGCAGDAVTVLRITRGDGGVVEKAEAHRVRGFRVMARRSRGDKSVGGFFADHFVDRVNGAADRAQSRLEAAGRHRGVGIEPHHAFLRRGVADLHDVVDRMAKRDNLERRRRRLHACERLEFFRLQRVLDRAQPLRPLGMAGRREMVQAGRMCDQERRHQACIRLMREHGVGAEHAGCTFDDGTLKGGGLDRDILGKKSRQRGARPGVGIGS